MPDFSLEQAAGAAQGAWIAGVDEVGRGPWAGPVVAAAAVLVPPPALPDALLAVIDDSKTLSRRKREAVGALLTEAADQGALHLAFGRAEVAEIDRLNILQASLLAMQRAVTALTTRLPRPLDLVLVDGRHCPQALPCPCQGVIKGDSQSFSIAIASILAKLRRDQEMAVLDQRCPGYGWEHNAGYGTKEHQESLDRLGVSPHHRRSFKPVAARLQKD